LVGGPESWGFAFWENGVLRGPIREMRERPCIWKSILMMLSRDDGNVQFGIFGGQDMFEQLPSLVVWI
jgi:hypothetical protein